MKIDIFFILTSKIQPKVPPTAPTELPSPVQEPIVDVTKVFYQV